LHKPCSWRADNPIVGHQLIGREALFLEQLAHQFHGCSLIASSLHQQVENLAFVVNRAPEPELRARNYHGHLIEMPPRVADVAIAEREPHM
jgi:hypothetical protein